MWPPSSDDVLLAFRTVAIAFQRTIDRTRRSSASSTGCGGSACGGIVFRYGVVPAGAGAAPVSWACPTTRSSRNWARWGPSLATTASRASSHSRVSWGSTSTWDAITAPVLSAAHHGTTRCAVASRGMRFCANVSLLFTEVALPERFAAARRAGLDAVELWWPRGEDLDAVAAAAAGSEVVLMNFDAGDMPAGERGLASDPERRDEFRANVPVALALGDRIGCRRFNAL